MELKKVGNAKQIISAYSFEMKDGAGYGKKFLLVHNDAMEVMFNADNAMDIAWIKYHGKNISFLTKNGFNNNAGVFGQQFDGGFLYTCGLDSVSACEKDKLIHGSLHNKKAENAHYQIEDDKVIVSATIVNGVLFGQNLILSRNYVVYPDKVEIHDVVENCAFKEDSFVLLYHINFGYPFLDAGMKLEFDQLETIPANAKSVNTVKDCKNIVEPVDDDTEDLFFHILEKGQVKLTNQKLGISCQMQYDTQLLPYLVQWKNLVSGDYVLGIEPSTVRFDQYQKRKIKPREKVSFDLSLTFNKF